MVSSSIRPTAWLQIQRSGRNGQERLMYEQSHRDYLRLVICIIVCLRQRLLIITVITPLPTKPSATKMPENWSWRTRQLLTCRCVSVMLLRSMQNTRSELADAKSRKWCLRWCCWSSSVAHQQFVSQCVKPLKASGVDNAASPDWQTPLNGIISTPRERLITMQKQLKNPEVY